MKLKRLLYTGFFALMALSCGKEENTKPPMDSNTAPTIGAKTFSVSENISDTHLIGTMDASDEDGDTLDFSITTNSDGLFKIGATDGKLTLAADKQLDLATKPQHIITVSVSDGELSANANMTINVTNVSPTFDEMTYSFLALEDILDTDVIGTVSATDNEEDDLTFEIIQNDNGMFEIDVVSGEISLGEGMALDFETSEQHIITVGVNDGTNETVGVQVTISVDNVIETMAEDPASFVTTWKTTSDGESVTIDTNIDYTYNYTIDWGDGTLEDLTLQDPTHQYATAGTYKVAIQGDFPAIYMVDGPSVLKLMSIEQWGSIVWKNFRYAFYGCENMVYNAIDVPDLSNVTDMYAAFYNATSFDGDIGNWDVSNITNMGWMFYNTDNFNCDLSSWKVGNVDTMTGMFNSASIFDNNLGNWKIESIIAMGEMFIGSGMSAVNFSDTLVGWSQQAVVPSNITCGASGLEYCSDNPVVWDAVTYLAGEKNWSFGGIAPIQCGI